MLHFKMGLKPPFLYCLDTYVIRDKDCFGRSCSSGKNLIPKLEIAKEAGYSGVELWHADIKQYLSEVGDIESLKTVLKSLGLSVPSYKVMDDWDQIEVLETAAALGATSCVVKLVKNEFNGTKPSLDSLVQQYNKLLARADALDINPSLEFMSLAKYYNNIEDVCNLLKLIDHPRSSLVLDTWHLWRNDSATFDNCPFHKINSQWISVVHYTDARKDLPREEQKDDARKIPGEGILDLSGFCNRLRSIDFCGWLSLNVYDRTLWDEDPLKVASRGLYAMKRTAEKDMISSLFDNHLWRNSQDYRCEGLWSKSYWSHLDPRIKNSNRSNQLWDILEEHLVGKTVLDFKCGFSPLAEHVQYGFDAFPGCISYLQDKYPHAEWFCQSDDKFSKQFNNQIDVLMHIGLGDSKTEIDSHLLIREKCLPKLIVIEAAANDLGEIDESKDDSKKNWERLKRGLKGKTYLFKTDMNHRSNRIMFVGYSNVS